MSALDALKQATQELATLPGGKKQETRWSAKLVPAMSVDQLLVAMADATQATQELALISKPTGSERAQKASLTTYRVALQDRAAVLMAAEEPTQEGTQEPTQDNGQDSDGS